MRIIALELSDPLGPGRICTRLPSQTHEWRPWTLSLTGSLLSAPSAIGFPGFGWCGSLLCPRARCAIALHPQTPVQARHSHERCPSSRGANELQAGAGGRTGAGRTGRRNHRGITGWQPHSGYFAGVVRKKLGLKLASEKSDGGPVYRIAGGGACSLRQMCKGRYVRSTQRPAALT